MIPQSESIDTTALKMPCPHDFKEGEIVHHISIVRLPNDRLPYVWSRIASVGDPWFCGLMVLKMLKFDQAFPANHQAVGRTLREAYERLRQASDLPDRILLDQWAVESGISDIPQISDDQHLEIPE